MLSMESDAAPQIWDRMSYIFVTESQEQPIG
jgi:hypothetical protein